MRRHVASRSGIRTTAAIAVLMTLMAVPAVAAGDTENGETLARVWCSSCHVVAEDQSAASADVPTFRSIARNPLTTPDRLAQFLEDPHPVMPDMNLSRPEVADIVAYIMSLK